MAHAVLAGAEIGDSEVEGLRSVVADRRHAGRLRSLAVVGTLVIRVHGSEEGSDPAPVSALEPLDREYETADQLLRVCSLCAHRDLVTGADPRRGDERHDFVRLTARARRTRTGDGDQCRHDTDRDCFRDGTYVHPSPPVAIHSTTTRRTRFSLCVAAD